MSCGCDSTLCDAGPSAVAGFSRLFVCRTLSVKTGAVTLARHDAPVPPVPVLTVATLQVLKYRLEGVRQLCGGRSRESRRCSAGGVRDTALPPCPLWPSSHWHCACLQRACTKTAASPPLSGCAVFSDLHPERGVVTRFSTSRAGAQTCVKQPVVAQAARACGTRALRLRRWRCPCPGSAGGTPTRSRWVATQQLEQQPWPAGCAATRPV